MLSISNLRTLVFVAENGGVRPAAQRLGRTPSAVSMALKQLEDAAGGALFEQDRKTHLTKLGFFTLETARDVLKHYENSCASIKAFALDEISRCTVAAVTSFAATVLPEAILSVREKFRNFEVVLREVHSVKMMDAVADGLVDVAFGRISIGRSDIETTLLMNDRYSVVCPSAHRLASLDRPITWADLADEIFISNESYDRNICLGLTEVHERARFHVSSVSSAFALVRAGVGITILPRLSERIVPNGLAFVDLEDADAYRVVGAFVRRGKKVSPATSMLLETTKSLLAERENHLPITKVAK